MPNQIHGHEIPDDIIVDCEVCDSGWRLYDVDALGFAEQKWGRCNQCQNGEITIQQEFSEI